MCGEMFNKGIMSHLTTLMGKISGTIDGVLAANTKDLSDEELQARKHLLSLTENVISLIWSLADASHKTLAAVNAAGCEGVLVKVLQGRDSLSVGVVLAAAQALYALTQDNWTFSKALTSTPDAISTLVEMANKDHTQAEKDLKGKGKAKKDGDAAMQDDDEEIGDGRVLLTRVLVVGTIRNIVQPGSWADKQVGIAALTNDAILPLVNSLLDVNLGNVVQRVTELVSQVPKETVPLAGKNLGTDHRSPAEVKLERVERMLVTVVTALEVLTGICAGLEDAEETMDEDASDDAEVADDQDMEDAMGDEALIAQGRDPRAAADQAAPTPVVNATSLPHLVGALRLPERLTALAQLTPLSFPPTGSEPSIHPPTTAALSSLHLRALEALNNIFVTTHAALAGSPSSELVGLAAALPATGLWEALFAIVSAAGSDAAALTARGQEMRREVMEAALAAAWGVVKTSPGTLTPAPATVQMLMDVLPALSSDAARARTLDTLAGVASRPGVTVADNAAIGAFLMTALASNPSTEITVALLNAIIDVYADETREYDAPVFVAGDYTSKLAATVARVRNATRSVDKRKQPELRSHAEEAYENLTAFIKYRRSL